MCNNNVNQTQDLGGCSSDLGHRLRICRRGGLGCPQLRAQLAPFGPGIGGTPFRRAVLLQLHPGITTLADRKREVGDVCPRVYCFPISGTCQSTLFRISLAFMVFVTLLFASGWYIPRLLARNVSRYHASAAYCMLQRLLLTSTSDYLC